jgi:arginine decarboxylase-like protein
LAIDSSSLLGVRTVVVLEKPSELPAVIAAVNALPAGARRPYLGLRARLGRVVASLPGGVRLVIWHQIGCHQLKRVLTAK